MIAATTARAMFPADSASAVPGEGEVDGAGPARAGVRAAAVDEPVEQREGDVVAEPDERAAGQQLVRGLGHALALDQVVDQEPGRPQRRDHEHADEEQREAPQPHALGAARGIAGDQYQDHHGLDPGGEPRNVHRAVARQPDAQGDVQHQEHEHRRHGRPARLCDHGRDRLGRWTGDLIPIG
jgi:hypothetical protein